MRRVQAVLLALSIGVMGHGSTAQAALSVPQTVFSSALLQAQLNTLGESIDALAHQQDGLVWTTSASTNSTSTIMFQLAGNPHQDEFGIAGLDLAGNLTGLCPIFPSTAFNTGYFAVASFRSGGVLRVNLFDAGANLVGTTTFSGVDRSRFVYYIKNPAGTFFSHMGFNVDGKVHSLVYAGTSVNAGSWWMAWEDSVNPDATADFNDGLVFLESLNPTPASRASWASLKARFR